MITAIQVVWWIGLAGALVATLVILKEVALLLRVLREIHQLAQFTRTAARGLREHAGGVQRLQAAGAPVSAVAESAQAVAAATAAIERTLQPFARAHRPDGEA